MTTDARRPRTVPRAAAPTASRTASRTGGSTAGSTAGSTSGSTSGSTAGSTAAHAAGRVAGPPAEPGARDLRRTILDTARALLDREGVAALSMREVARRAGVTHQAPYHHFADRESILAELVTEGFDALAGRLERANEVAAARGHRAGLLASCEAYVGFALERPGVFRVMFRPELCDPARFAQARAAGERAYAQLERLVRMVHGADPDATIASLYWAHVHGLAGLLIDGPLGERLESGRARDAHVRAVAGRFADMVLPRGDAHGGSGDVPAP